jgi:hypothetical protein
MIIPPLPEGGGGILFYLQDIFLSNCCWQKSDIWSQASYRYTILWVAFLDPSDSYFLFADFVDFYTHWTYMLIFRVCHIVGSVFGPIRLLLPVCRLCWFLYTLNIYAHFSGMPYCGKRFWTHQIPTSCLPTLLIFIHIEHICSFFVAFF